MAIPPPPALFDIPACLVTRIRLLLNFIKKGLKISQEENGLSLYDKGNENPCAKETV